MEDPWLRPRGGGVGQMCQGLDPKYMLRDVEARLKDFPVQTDSAPRAQPLVGWIMVMLQNLRQGMAKHV